MVVSFADLNTKRFKRLLASLILLLLLVLWNSPAHAYLDPGTGSLLLYAIVGISASILFFLRGLYYKAAGFLFGSGFKNVRQFGGSDLVFYSEGKNYWNVFAPVIRAFDSRGIRCVYLTSDNCDPGLNYSSDNVVTRYLGGGYKTAAYMNNISAKLVVMTTPQLDVLMLRRSKLVKHYAHLIHAPTDVLLYKKYAFDYFDSVLCSGPHQIENLRKLERKRDLPKKLLFQTGCTYYDEMIKGLNERDIKEQVGVTVLIAPTWGKNSCLDRYETKLIKPLLDAEYNVILRPHPQMFESQKELLDGIKNAFSEYKNFEIDDTPSGEFSMARSDILISDVSGIVFDYAFLFEKPVLIIDSDVERGGFEAEDVDSEIWELTIRPQLGRTVCQEDLGGIAKVVRQTLDDHNKPDIKKVRTDYCYNFGQAGHIAANHITGILQEI